VTFSKSLSADIENGLGSRPGSISSQSDAAIPSNLSLDRVLANETCTQETLQRLGLSTLTYITCDRQSSVPVRFLHVPQAHRAVARELGVLYLVSVPTRRPNLPQCAQTVYRFKDYEARYNEDSHPNSPSQVTPLLVAPGAEKFGPYAYSGVTLEEVDQSGEDPGTMSRSTYKTTVTDIAPRFSAVHRDPGDFPGSETMQSILAATQLGQDSDKNVLQPRRAPECCRTVPHIPISQRAEHPT
jgi:hypothetical protein